METHRFFRDHNAVTEPKEPTTDVLPVTALAVLHAIRRIQWFTVAWMIIEAVVALTTAVHSHSVALAAFGAGSTNGAPGGLCASSTAAICPFRSCIICSNC